MRQSGAWNRGRVSYIVKRRTLESYRGAFGSAIRHGAWCGVFYASSLEQARAWLEAHKAGLYDWAVFHRGRRVAESVPTTVAEPTS